MDTYQDIIICSKFNFTLDKNGGQEIKQTLATENLNNANSVHHLNNVHRKIVDSIQ